MKHFKFSLVLLVTVAIYAQPVQIDMHGGKDIKKPFHMDTKKPETMHEFLKPYAENNDTNQTLKPQ